LCVRGFLPLALASRNDRENSHSLPVLRVAGKCPHSSNQPGRVATFPTMKPRSSLIYLASLAIAVAGVAAPTKPVASPPLLQQQGTARQLIVDGKPFLVLGAELHNSSASSLDYMKSLWPKLAATHLNTVLATVSWELIEPEEGKFDFTLVDGVIEGARANNLHLVILWFASWKNGKSTYQPLWVKTNQAQFPLAQNEQGKSLNTLTPLSDANRDADARAFAAFMRHLREVDGTKHTVLNDPGGKRSRSTRRIPRSQSRGEPGVRRTCAEGVDGLSPAA